MGIKGPLGISLTNTEQTHCFLCKVGLLYLQSPVLTPEKKNWLGSTDIPLFQKKKKTQKHKKTKPTFLSSRDSSWLGSFSYPLPLPLLILKCSWRIVEKKSLDQFLVLASTLPLTSCVTLDKSPNVSGGLGPIFISHPLPDAMLNSWQN